MSLPPQLIGCAPNSAAERVRFRRALTLLLMTVALPGSAQLAAGNKQVGRVAMRTFLAALSALAAFAVTALVSRHAVLTLLTTPWLLGVLRFVLVAYAVGWAFLVIDAWRIANPPALRQGHRLAMTGLNGALCLGLSGALLFASHLVAVQRTFITTVFRGTTVAAPEKGRLNILLLGGDAGPERVGLRPDSVTVASIDERTGRTVLFGLPRNLADVPFPRGTAMHRAFPHGFDCTEECYLNAVNTWANDHPKLFPQVRDPGVLATTQAVEQITGLKVGYYVLVDLGSFQQLVDAVGGVTLDVRQSIPIGGPTLSHVTGWIKPGIRHLDGYDTLWFARSRATSDDYSRMARQKCVMNAMLHQLSPSTVVTHFDKIARAGEQLVSTSIPPSEIDHLTELALMARRLPVSTVSFVPPTIDTSHPNWRLIRHEVRRAIAHSEALDAPHHHRARHHGRHQHRAAKRPSTVAQYAANDSTDLSRTC
ncbi:MAG TPA: LCP family protein [Nocardioidaceae bacterium]|nr:LCP family protein [Nocardioidaceae bacterium]